MSDDVRSYYSLDPLISVAGCLPRTGAIASPAFCRNAVHLKCCPDLLRVCLRFPHATLKIAHDTSCNTFLIHDFNGYFVRRYVTPEVDVASLNKLCKEQEITPLVSVKPHLF
jgi:hypothetical protein